MKRKLLSVSAGVVAMVLVAPASADMFFDSNAAPVVTSANGRLYVGAGAALYSFEAPKRSNVGAIYEDDNPPISRINIHSFQPSDRTPLVGATLGYAFAPGSGPQLGSHPRVEISGHIFSADDESTATSKTSTAAAGTYTDFLGIDGSGFILDPGGPGDTIRGHFTANYHYFDIGVHGRTDLRLGDRTVVTPSVGIVAARLGEHHGIQYRNVDGAFDFNNISESVSTWYVGPAVGAQVRMQVARRVSLQAGATALLSYAWSNYDGLQTFQAIPGTATAHDSQRKFAFRTVASAGATYDAGWGTLSVMGGVDYWNYAPVIMHPAPPLGIDYDAVTSTATAGLGSGSMTNYFFGARLTVPFNGP